MIKKQLGTDQMRDCGRSKSQLERPNYNDSRSTGEDDVNTEQSETTSSNVTLAIYVENSQI